MKRTSAIKRHEETGLLGNIDYIFPKWYVFSLTLILSWTAQFCERKNQTINLLKHKQEAK